jgi:hypothetical protein
MLREQIGEVLAEELPEIARRNERVHSALQTKYPHLTGLFHLDSIGLVDASQALHHAQTNFFKQQRAVLDATTVDEATFRSALELSARTLMEYVLYRNYTIKRLEEMGQAELETAVHNLLVPRYSRFNGSELTDDIFRNNAWIFDDRFMTFRTVLSEAEMEDVLKAITHDDEVGRHSGRPDISLIFERDPSKHENVDVVIIELKRRRVDDKEGPYSSIQLTQRAEKLVDHCPNIQRAWYYGVFEIDDALARTLRGEGWAQLYSLGKVFYREKPIERLDGSIVPSPTYLVSYEALTKDAKERNHAFLELLRAEFTRATVSEVDETLPL